MCVLYILFLLESQNLKFQAEKKIAKHQTEELSLDNVGYIFLQAQVLVFRPR